MSGTTPPPGPQDPAPSAGPARSVPDAELARLRSLKDQGFLTEDEYDTAAASLVRGTAVSPAEAPADQEPTGPGEVGAQPGSAPSDPTAARVTPPEAPHPPLSAPEPEPVVPASGSAPTPPAGSGPTGSGQAPGPATGSPGPSGPEVGQPLSGGGRPGSGPAAEPTPAAAGAGFVNTADRQVLIALAKRWWLFLVTGLLWIIIALILMQFTTDSVTVIGYITGAMLLAAGAEYCYIGTVVNKAKWMWFVFGALFLAGGLWAMVNPGRTAAALAVSLGLLFALIGILWIIEGFAARADYSLWWLNVVTGALMIGLAVWAANQTTVAKMATLLTLATVWAMVSGITDIFRAFAFRRFGKLMDAIRG